MELDASSLVKQSLWPTAAAGDSSGPLNKRQILFTNWLLLGLDIPTLERKYSIPFNRDMFNLPNKAGAEAILYFLFSRLNPVMCKEEFRDCWPVRDKKTEALFYRTCNKWLRNIQNDEPDSRLPRINASLFMSPGGEKFYQLLFSFTNYVIQQVTKRECDVKPRDQLSWPQLTPHNKHLSEVMYPMLQCGVVQRRQKFMEQMERSITVSEQWRETVSDLVRENRRLSKSTRDLEHQLRDERQKAHEKGIARGSPLPSRRSFSSEQERSSHMIKRAHRVQKVRDKWKKLDAFCNVETRERQVIESILDRTLQKYHIDAADISIKVPDLLLRECENEILKRHVDNTYEGGKLNILSLLQLWNLSLHLYIERFHQVGVADLESESSHLTAAVQTHHAQITNASAFENMLSDDFLPLLKQSVSRLRTKLDAETSHMVNTPQSECTRSLGLGLVSSTPPVSFTPKDDDNIPGQSLHITPQQETVMTPEAADNIATTVAKSARKVAKTLFQGSPVYAPKFAMQGKLPLSSRVEGSRIPQPYQTRPDRQLITPSRQTPSRPEQNLQHHVDRPLHILELDSQTLNTSIPADHVSDVLSSTQSSHSTLTESQFLTGSPRTSNLEHSLQHGSPRNTTGPGFPRNTAVGEESSENTGFALQQSSRSTGENSISLKGPSQSQRPSVDDFVDEVVSHVLDEDDTENQPPMDYLQMLQDQQTSRSLPRSPFLQFQYQSEVLQDEDLNTSNNNRQQKVTRFKNGQNLSQSQLDNIEEREHFTSFSREDTDIRRSPGSGPVQHSPVHTSMQEDREVFRHPDIPINFFKNGPQFLSPTGKGHRREHRRSVGSEVFRHPDIPEDMSPEIGSEVPPMRRASHTIDDRRHSQNLNPKVSKMPDPLERYKLSESVHDTENLLSPWTSTREPAEGEASQRQENPVTSVPGGVEPSQQSPLSQLSTGQSPERKLGSHLETEIRRMWRESLDGDTHPGSPAGETIPASKSFGDTPSQRSASSLSNKTKTGHFQLETNGFMKLGAEDGFTTLDDITADILLSPENLDEEEISHRTSPDEQRGLSLHPKDDMFNTKTPQIPRLGSKYTTYHTSPLLSAKTRQAGLSVDSSTVDTEPTAVPKFHIDADSPFMLQSLPVFSRTAWTKTKENDDSILKTPVNTSHLTSVFNEALNDTGLDEDITSDLLVPLDDSFAPLRDGLQLEGRSPFKSVASERKQTATSSDDPLDDIMARFHQLKKTVKHVLHDNSEAMSKVQDVLNPDLMQSTSSSDERLMLALEEKYVKGMNSSWSLLDDETLDDINYLQDS